MQLFRRLYQLRFLRNFMTRSVHYVLWNSWYKTTLHHLYADEFWPFFEPSRASCVSFVRPSQRQNENLPQALYRYSKIELSCLTFNIHTHMRPVFQIFFVDVKEKTMNIQNSIIYEFLSTLRKKSANFQHEYSSGRNLHRWYAVEFFLFRKKKLTIFMHFSTAIIADDRFSLTRNEINHKN